MRGSIGDRGRGRVTDGVYDVDTLHWEGQEFWNLAMVPAIAHPLFAKDIIGTLTSTNEY